MDKLKYISGILLLIGFVISYLLRNYTNIEGLTIDYIYTLITCLGVSIVFFYIGKKEKNNKVKWLFDYGVSMFFLAMFSAYILNLSFDVLVGVNKIFFSFITTTVLCFLGLFVKY